MDDELRQAAYTVLMPGFSGTEAPAWMSEAAAKGLVSLCLYAENVHNTEQLGRLTEALRQIIPHALLGIDEEGGDVTRIYYQEGSPFPGPAVLGRIDDLDQTRAVGEAVGALLRSLGINLALAPVVDVNSNPYNPVIGVRSFGQDTGIVTRHSVAMIDGLHMHGVAACAKHFPGHGDTMADSHLALPVVDQPQAVLRGRELVPFMRVIDAGCEAIMTSHIVASQIDRRVPATFSRAIIRDLLRDELGFPGVIITDALDMRGAALPGGMPTAAVKALQAGCDLLCLGPSTTSDMVEEIVRHVLHAVKSGAYDGEDLLGSAQRVRDLAERVALPAQNEMSEFVPPGLPGPEQIATTFRCGSQVIPWLKENGADPLLVKVTSKASLVVGEVPWGTFDDHEITVTPEELTRLEPAERPVIVIARGLHAQPEVSRTISRWRMSGCSVLVVEMAWPLPEQGPLRIDTFGASRAVGEALRQVIKANSVVNG